MPAQIHGDSFLVSDSVRRETCDVDSQGWMMSDLSSTDSALETTDRSGMHRFQPSSTKC